MKTIETPIINLRQQQVPDVIINAFLFLVNTIIRLRRPISVMSASGWGKNGLCYTYCYATVELSMPATEVRVAANLVKFINVALGAAYTFVLESVTDPMDPHWKSPRARPVDLPKDRNVVLLVKGYSRRD